MEVCVQFPLTPADFEGKDNYIDNDDCPVARAIKRFANNSNLRVGVVTIRNRDASQFIGDRVGTIERVFLNDNEISSGGFFPTSWNIVKKAITDGTFQSAWVEAFIDQSVLK